ncbi:MAG: DUF1570 domain-containing protein [Planctomycetaceae bacterium]|nr:DUF1570 domain-containing protein [Planctomycetaceae bacterium]
MTGKFQHLTRLTDLSRRRFLQQVAWGTTLATTRSVFGNIAPDDSEPAGEPMERVKFQTEMNDRTEEGRIIIEAQDGGVILEGRDGRLWTILPDDLIERKVLMETQFAPFSHQQLGERMTLELGENFEHRKYGPLVICTNAGKNYADWCGHLFVRLQSTFQKFWKRDDLPLQEPEFPLPICLFATRKQYYNYALADADAATAESYGYYSVKTNRTAMFNITADERGAARSVADVNRRMSKLLGNVATMVHEATHQFAFNGGLHQRYADNPLWLMEGMAMFFEVPDLNNKAGWASVGRPNYFRLNVLKNSRRPPNSLQTLIRDDARFLDPDTAAVAYAEAWALTFYFIKRRRDEYAAYLKQVAEKPMLAYLTPEERIAEFEKFFGDDWAKLDEEMVSLLRRIR